MNSLKNELKVIHSGKSVSYAKASIIIALVVAGLLTIFWQNNFIKDGNVVVVDLDNSHYSREFINQLEASEYIKVNAVINIPVDINSLFYQDKNLAVVYIPKDLEKDYYNADNGIIGVFYDNTNTSQTAQIKTAISEIIAVNNSIENSNLSLSNRFLFNPVGSFSNSAIQGMLFFFSSWFFASMIIGIVPRLRMQGELKNILLQGNPITLIWRIVPYSFYLLTALYLGMAILRIWGDMIIQGSIFLFLVIQVIYIFTLAMFSMIVGWSAPNPVAAASRVLFFIPAGFFLGGVMTPMAMYPEWVQYLSYIFPLRWELYFVRDILMRGASIIDISTILGLFLGYLLIIVLIFYRQFYTERKKILIENRNSF